MERKSRLMCKFIGVWKVMCKSIGVWKVMCKSMWI